MITYVTKTQFFDRQVVAAEHKAKMRYLFRGSSAIKLTAKRLQRYRKRASRPGEAPSAHRPMQLLRDRTYSGYDARTDSAVIGPEKINGHGEVASGTVPSVLEFGGETLVEEVELSGGLWKRRGLVPLSAAIISRRKRRAKIEPRPFMGPALAINLPRLPAMWANSIKA